MPAKFAKFKKKINGVVYDLNVISDGSDIIVDEQGHTVAEKIDEFDRKLETVAGDTVPQLIEKVTQMEQSSELPNIKNTVVRQGESIESIQNTMATKDDVSEINNSISDISNSINSINDTLNSINSKLTDISTTLGITEESNGVPTEEEIKGWFE